MGMPGGPEEPAHPLGEPREQQTAPSTPPASAQPAMPTATPAQPEVQPSVGAVPQSPQPAHVVTGAPEMRATPPPPVVSELPAKPRRNRLRIALVAATAAALLVAIALGALLFYGYQQEKWPIDAAQTFCADLKAQRYAAAYSRFSLTYQARVSKDQFLAELRLHDVVDGQVTACGLPGVAAGPAINLGGDKTAVFGARIVRATRGSFEGTIALVKDGDVWRIDRLDDALQGTDLGPLTVGQRLCAALVSGDYATAYMLYSAREQQSLGSTQDFAATYKHAFGGSLALSGCAPDIKSYQAVGPTASLDIRLTVTESTSLGTQTIDVPTPVTLRFIQEGGAWKVDQFEINIPNV